MNRDRLKLRVAELNVFDSEGGREGIEKKKENRFAQRAVDSQERSECVDESPRG